MTKPAKKIKKKPGVTYVYYVIDYMYWRVMILRYELVKKTSKQAVVLDAIGDQKRLTLEDASGKVCDSAEEALAYAKIKVKERKEKLKQYEAELAKSRQEIKEGRIRVVDPKKLKNLKIDKYVF